MVTVTLKEHTVVQIGYKTTMLNANLAYEVVSIKQNKVMISIGHNLYVWVLANKLNLK